MPDSAVAATERNLTRTTVFFSETVSVHELSSDGPAGCAPTERTAQWVAHDTVLLTRAGCAALAHGARTRRPVIAEPTRVVLLSPGDAFQVTYPLAGEFRGTVLIFPRSASGDAERGSSDGGHRAIAATAPALLRYHQYRNALVYASRNGVLSDLAAEEESLAILDLARAGDGRRGGPGQYAAHQLLADRARMLLAAAPGDSHRLGDVARSLGVSPFHLARVFRAQVGMPMHRYLVHLRLALALEQLGDGENNLSALALRLGFATHSHFSSAFRRTFGRTPQQVRETLTAARLRSLRETLDRQS